jgi:hypothetical protein
LPCVKAGRPLAAEGGCDHGCDETVASWKDYTLPPEVVATLLDDMREMRIRDLRRRGLI